MGGAYEGARLCRRFGESGTGNGQAVGLYAVTNIDDILVLALFFAQGAGHKNSTRNIALG